MDGKVKNPYGIVSSAFGGQRCEEMLPELSESVASKAKEFREDFFFMDGPVAHLVVSIVGFDLETDESGNKTLKRTFAIQENTYNTETKELREGISDEHLLEVDFSNLQEFCKQLVLQNQYLVDAMKQMLAWKETTKTVSSVMFSHCSPELNVKLYKLCATNQALLEQVIKTSPQILFDPAALKALDITEKNLKKSVALPSAVIENLVKRKRESLIPYFQILCDDGNDAVILNKFLNDIRSLTKGYRNLISYLVKTLSILSEAKQNDDSMTVTEILRYTLHQTMYHNDWDMDGYIKVCEYFRDYTGMRKTWGVKDRYPSNILEAHDILQRNANGYSDEDKEAFKTVAEGLKHLEHEVVVKAGTEDEEHWSFIIPKTIDDLVLEGVDLHHCIGSWGKKIIAGTTRIVFMRRTDDIQTSVATIEIDKNNNICQSKIAYNDDLPEDLAQVAMYYGRWLKTL